MKVNPHATNTVTVHCSSCGRKCHCPAQWELVAPWFDGGTNRHDYQRAWADLDAPTGTFYCTDCANDLAPQNVSGFTPQTAKG